ncbi:hypothetical protein [Butyrivibrio sp. LC3010]|uniref:hypothetical protein n=1 Tax=Butyrivibrio sp. LC3010 TaxID=1280680 RepID=UPI000414FC46|nr:hypothetical protein [Butyrivibrio sp. LC3010]
MKRILALMLAGAIIITTPSAAIAATDEIELPSPVAQAYRNGKAEGDAQGYSRGWKEGNDDGYNKGYQTGKELGELKGKVDVYENTVIPRMDRRIDDLQTQVSKLYDKVIEMAQKETNITVTVKANGNNKKPKVTVKKVLASNSGNSVSEPPFVHTVLNAPGLGCTTPVGQGGRLILNGKPTRATFTMRESTSGKVSSAQVLAAGIGGKVKNVVETYAPGVRFSTAQVDFKVYGALNGDIYRVYQLGPNGTWKEIQVDQVRDGHVVCTVFKAGTFAFIKMN